MKLKIILVSLGSAGDVHPFVGLGIALAKRGHLITLMTNEHFRPLADDHGFGFVGAGSAKEYHEALQNPDIWKNVKGARILARWMCDWMPAQYQAIADRYEPGSTVVVASGGAFGARIAHDKLGVPIVTVALQPALLRSAYRMPVIPGVPRLPDWLPPFTKRTFFRAADAVVDRLCHVSEINAFRADLGLPPVKRLMKDWWLSPQRVIALFPEWYCPPQPDWAEQIRLTGFPLFDESRDGAALPADVESFLEQGEPPIVFTPGTGMLHGHSFFEAAVQACLLLDRQGILLTRYPEQIPQDLPPSVRHFSYVPFSQLLPRAAALVHHGGVGTLAQAMAAGIPQLIRPMAYDQPDNARRLKLLGVADSIRPGAFRAKAVSRKLRYLLNSPEVASRSRALARKLEEADGIQRTCELVEELATSAP